MSQEGTVTLEPTLANQPPRGDRPTKWGGPSATAVTALVLVAAVLLWIIGLWRADPRTMSDLGLVSLLGWPTLAGLALLVGSLLAALRRRASELVLGTHLVVLIVLVHGTPAVLFDTLRYSWAWKHLGIIDYILRYGVVDPDIRRLGVYHNWPGFFGGSAVLADLADPANLLTVSIWAPVFFNLVNLLALRFLFRSLGADQTRTWLAITFFFLSTWVGQDYFAPQALAYLLYLVLIGIVLRHFRRTSPAERVGTSTRWVGPLLVVVVLMAAIASSHQITPMVMFLALTVLVATRQITGWYLPVLAAGFTVGWVLTVARPYMEDNFADLLQEFNNPLGNVEGTLDKSATITGAQHLVSLSGRAVVVIITVAAIVGVLRLRRRSGLNLAALGLLLAPGLMLFLTAFGGELLFRIFLFASPFLCYFAAAATTLRRTDEPDGPPPRVPWVPAAVLSVLLVPGFLLAYYGKDQQNYFTPQEVAAGEWIADHAAPNTLLVRGSTNYPRDFRNYEFFRTVDITSEPAPARQRILADPVDVLGEWLADPRHPRSYLLITRSQMIANDSLGPMPPGSLRRIVDALSASPQFVPVFRNSDAVVFTLAATP